MKGEVGMVMLEAGGLLTGGTAEETENHIKGTWVRGDVTIQALRMELGDKTGDLVPMNRGGVKFSKVYLSTQTLTQKFVRTYELSGP